MAQLAPSTTAVRVFADRTQKIYTVAGCPDGRRMVTGSQDTILRLWDLDTGVVLKKMRGHGGEVWGMAVSRDGRLIASGDENGRMIAWNGDSGEPLTQAFKAHSDSIRWLDFSPDGKELASGSDDRTMKLWNTTSWELQGNTIYCSNGVRSVRYSPSGTLLAIGTYSTIEIYNTGTRECTAHFKGHGELGSWNLSLAWTPDGTRLLSAGDERDPTIREWDASTWQQVGDPWKGHTSLINCIAVHPAGTLVASAASDNHVRLWRLTDRQTIAIFQHSSPVSCVIFSMDSKHFLSSDIGEKILEWAVPKDALPKDSLKEPPSKDRNSDTNIIALTMAARDALIKGDLFTAEKLFTQEIDVDANNYTSYANRSLVMARKHDWDHALDDSIKSITIQPSLTAYISKGIALCRKGHIRDARTAFDIAFMFTNGDSQIIHLLLLVKVIALFDADQHEEAMSLVQQLAVACPNSDTLACHVVEAYLCVQLGINALNDAHHDEAAVHFAAAANSSAFSSTAAIDSIYTDFVVLFGWDLKSLWQNAHQKRCDALRGADRLEEALESFRYMMDTIDENAKACCLDWSNAFKQEYCALYLANGDAAFAASDYDRAIDLYSVAIELGSTSDTIFANCSKAKLEKMLWEDALFDAQKVIELNPSSHIGYQLKHTALYGSQRYDEAVGAFQMMLGKMDSAHDMQIRKLREQYVCPSEAEGVIRKSIDVQLDISPLRLLNTTTGLLCDREAQISAFKSSAEYNELLLALTTKHPDIRMERITEVVAVYFRRVMLSHRWGEKEPLLHDISDKVVYELKAAGGLAKLQSFCEIARKAECHWAWVDSCCIDQHNNVELQKSLNSMFAWYHHSALTIVYLSDVLPSSKSGALAKSAWNTRGWTVPEFLAPKTILFYKQDWTLYLDDGSPNHKESVEIMHELEDATGIDTRTLVTFQPGMRNAREKLQWASTRVTTVPEDIAYSLFGIFGIQLPILYGENKQNALGRLLQEIVARSGDITALDWIGQSSDFNSCLPADITSYATRQCALPSLSEDEIQTAISSLQNNVAVELASKLYTLLDNMSAPRFANCRLHLPCIAFRVTEVKRTRGAAQEAFKYGVKADGLQDLLITSEQTLVQFSRARPTRQTFLLVRPWDRRLLELPDFAEPVPAFADDAESSGDWSEPESPLDDFDESPSGWPGEELADSESHLRALRLIIRLGQPFRAFLLAQQRGGEYRRIASDHVIIAQVKDMASVHNMMDIRTPEIL